MNSFCASAESDMKLSPKSFYLEGLALKSLQDNILTKADALKEIRLGHMEKTLLKPRNGSLEIVSSFFALFNATGWK